jgi:hypothetical protein
MAVDEPGRESHSEEAPARDAHQDVHQQDQRAQGPTVAQLRRFIKSRPYVPLHELRRRFELIGDLDDVTGVDVPDGHVYVGLPEREAEFLAGLVRDGDVGLELSKDPPMPIVVGVFPMKPVTRA